MLRKQHSAQSKRSFQKKAARRARSLASHWYLQHRRVRIATHQPAWLPRRARFKTALSIPRLERYRRQKCSMRSTIPFSEPWSRSQVPCQITAAGHTGRGAGIKPCAAGKRFAVRSSQFAVRSSQRCRGNGARGLSRNRAVAAPAPRTAFSPKSPFYLGAIAILSIIDYRYKCTFAQYHKGPQLKAVAPMTS